MKAQLGRPNGQHRVGSMQLKLWLVGELKHEFDSVCAHQGVSDSEVMRGLRAAYVQQASVGVRHGDAAYR